MTNRQDPIRENYYKPLEVAEVVSEWLFYIGALLSFALFLIDRKQYEYLYQLITIFFILAVVGYFLLGLISRHYLFVRAEDARRAECLSHVSGIELIHHRTIGYYNNSEKEVGGKLMLAVLEDAHFTKSVLLAMLKNERIKITLYMLVFFVLLLNRATSFDWMVTASQVLFSEEIIAKWFRLEWLRIRVENLYKETRSIFQSHPSSEVMMVKGFEAFSNYECGKSVGGILLSEKIFRKMNHDLTLEWERIKQGLY